MSFPAAATEPSVIGPDDPAAGGESSSRADAGLDETADDPVGDAAAASLTDQVVAVARAAAVDEAGRAELVGDYLGAVHEDDVAVAAAFAATDRGYLGWYWSVILALVEPGLPTVSEVVLLPGEQALLAPPWVPWDQRIRAGDVGPGDLLPTAPDDIRLVPGYIYSDDPAVKEVEYEFGFGRPRVLSREGRDDAAQRWHDGPFGPSGPLAQAAPATCMTCGFFTPLSGLLGMTLGACANEYSPADGRVVDVEFGCGAHSQTVIDAPLISASTETVVDELTLEVHLHPVRQVAAAADVARNEIAGTETAGSDTAGTETAGSETAGSETAGSETAGSETAGSETAGIGVAAELNTGPDAALDPASAEPWDQSVDVAWPPADQPDAGR